VADDRRRRCHVTSGNPRALTAIIVAIIAATVSNNSMRFISVLPPFPGRSPLESGVLGSVTATSRSAASKQIRKQQSEQPR
jgi:hypothetical protein